MQVDWYPYKLVIFLATEYKNSGPTQSPRFLKLTRGASLQAMKGTEVSKLYLLNFVLYSTDWTEFKAFA